MTDPLTLQVCFVVIMTIWMMLVARLAGGGYIAPRLPAPLPEIVFGLTFGVAAFMWMGNPYLAFAGAVWSYAWMETGHGNAYHMGFHQYKYPPRHQTLDFVVLPICRLFGWESRSPQYCWLFMGLKGLLIGASLGWYGLPLAILWPLSYWISYKFTDSSELAEHLSGACAGLLVALTFLSYL